MDAVVITAAVSSTAGQDPLLQYKDASHLSASM